jgi:molybdate transport system ATP-binding protein
MKGTEAKNEVYSKILFDLQKVVVSFDGKNVLGPLTWQMREGENWAVVGKNGAGKSTLLGLLSGDHPQIYRNQISLLGKTPGKGFNIWEHRRAVGFFSPELALQFTSRETVWNVLLEALGAESFAQERHEAEQLLRLVGLDGKKEAPYQNLNEEEQRLLLVARAVLRGPRVLLLDEPAQGLEEPVRDRLFALLDYASAKSALVFVTHYLGEWPRCVNRRLKLSESGLKD